MRRLLLFATLLTASLAAAPSAQAAERLDLRSYQSVGTAALALENGSGRAKIVRRAGAILGRVGEGRIAVTAPRGARPVVSFSGCERKRRLSRRTIVCLGRGLRFALSLDRRVVLRGVGIDVSAVMRGRLTLEGTRGTYRIGSARPRAWPRTERTWSVGG